jgi:hypothetical protein
MVLRPDSTREPTRCPATRSAPRASLIRMTDQTAAAVGHHRHRIFRTLPAKTRPAEEPEEPTAATSPPPRLCAAGSAARPANERHDALGLRVADLPTSTRPLGNRPPAMRCRPDQRGASHYKQFPTRTLAPPVCLSRQGALNHPPAAHDRKLRRTGDAADEDPGNSTVPGPKTCLIRSIALASRSAMVVLVLRWRPGRSAPFRLSAGPPPSWKSRSPFRWTLGTP